MAFNFTTTLKPRSGGGASTLEFKKGCPVIISLHTYQPQKKADGSIPKMQHLLQIRVSEEASRRSRIYVGDFVAINISDCGKAMQLAKVKGPRDGYKMVTYGNNTKEAAKENNGKPKNLNVRLTLPEELIKRLVKKERSMTNCKEIEIKQKSIIVELPGIFKKA